MSVKRMRVFAGPNGSGKTTIFKSLLAAENITLGVYVNADDIEKELTFSNSLNFTKYQLTVPENQLRHFFKESAFSPVKRHEPDLWGRLSVDQNDLKIDTKVDSYLAADIAEFIRQQLLVAGISFTYETVMSHPGKIDFFQQALIKNYRVYLYYIATEDPDININRVNVRVAQNGHPVSPDVVRSRYYKSLQNLKNAVKQTNRAYIFDNTQKQVRLIAEITDGLDAVLNDVTDTPAWVVEHLLS